MKFSPFRILPTSGVYKLLGAFVVWVMSDVWLHPLPTQHPQPLLRVTAVAVDEGLLCHPEVYVFTFHSLTFQCQELVLQSRPSECRNAPFTRQASPKPQIPVCVWCRFWLLSVVCILLVESTGVLLYTRLKIVGHRHGGFCGGWKLGFRDCKVFVRQAKLRQVIFKSSL